MNNPIAFPDYEEGGIEVLTNDAADMLIELYKFYSNKKKNGDLGMVLFDSSFDVAEIFGIDHDSVFRNLSELKRNSLICAAPGTDSYSSINLTDKAIVFYEHAPKRETKKLITSINGFFKHLFHIK